MKSITCIYYLSLSTRNRLEEVAEFKYLGSIVTNDGSSQREILSRIAQARLAFNKMKFLKVGSVDLELRKRLVRSHVWSVVMYGSEAWILRKTELNRLEALEMWCWRRLLGISWKDKVTNVEVLNRVGETGGELVSRIMKGKKQWLTEVVNRKNQLVQQIIEGKIDGKRGRGRPRIGRLDWVKVQGG